ncbi:hypothetical protein PMV_334 [Port-miou virus]|uniref:Uncharacterized protein n=1 Tax=Port-miou virus TaxID=1733873 RepID=A0A0N7G2G1_9VIRU|nr:hypothetical protein PMV_334 [Port-miou virus]
MSSVNIALANIVSALLTESDFSEKFVEHLAEALDVEESVVEAAVASFFKDYEMEKSAKKPASTKSAPAKKSSTSSAKVDMKVVNKNIVIAKKKSAEDDKQTYYNVSTGRLGTKSTKTKKLYVFKDKLFISGKEDCPKFAAVLKNLSENDEDSSDTDVSSGEEEKLVKKPLARTSSKAKLNEVSNSSESEEEEKPKKKPVAKKAPVKKPAKKADTEDEDSDSEEEEKPKKKAPVKKVASKKSVSKKTDVEDESEEEEKTKKKPVAKKAAKKDDSESEEEEKTKKKPAPKKPVAKKVEEESSESETLESEDDEPVKKPLAKTSSKKDVKAETKKPLIKTSSKKNVKAETKKSEPEPEPEKATKTSNKKDVKKTEAEPEKPEIKPTAFTETNESGFKYNEETGLVEHPNEPGVIIAMMDGDEMVELDDESIEECGKRGLVHRTDKKGFSKFIASLTKGKETKEDEKKSEDDEDEEVEF